MSKISLIERIEKDIGAGVTENLKKNEWNIIKRNIEDVIKNSFTKEEYNNGIDYRRKIYSSMEGDKVDFKTPRDWKIFIQENEEEYISVLFAGVKDNEVFLSMIGVKNEYKGQKYGTKLIKTIMEYFKDKTFSLTCEENLIPFYQKFGFTVRNRGPKFATLTKK